MIAGALAAFARAVSGATVHWTQPLEGVRQRVYFGNHGSHLDFILIWASIPPHLRASTRPIAGADYWGGGPLRRYVACNVFQAILVERSAGPTTPERATQAIERIAEAMGDANSIIVFPEGTRSLNGELLPFKSGLYHLCRMKPHLELVPVYLANLSRILPKGELVPVPLRGRVVFGAPIRFDANEAKDAFLTRARNALVSLRHQ